MHPKGADGMVNSVGPDQTGPLEAVWSGSALFAQTYLSENRPGHYGIQAILKNIFVCCAPTSQF